MTKWWKYIKPYLPYFILGPLCMIIEVIGEVLMPRLFARIINYGVLEKDAFYVICVALFMVLTSVIMMLGGVGGAWFGSKASVNFGSDLRNDIYKKIQSYSFSNIDKFSTGSLVTRLTNDVMQLQNFVSMLLRMCLRAPGMLIGALIMAISLNKELAGILAIIIPILLITQFILIKIGFPRFSKMQTKIDSLNSNVQEGITNIRVIKSFVREEHEIKKFGKANSELKEATMNAMKVMIFIQPLMALFMNLTTLLVVWMGGKQVIVGDMLIGDLTSFITYITQILSSLMMVSMLFLISSRALASAKRIREVLDEKVELNDENSSRKDKTVSKGDIEFVNVSFKYYKDNSINVLDNISFKINSGETVGIIGSTGCGKTTLVSMIPRLYDVDTGHVYVDGVDVKEYSIENLRKGVGMVLQNNTLFSGTIEENLRWGDDDASLETIRMAAENAQADSFIMSFPNKYDSDIGQGGTNVSGGQKQRLCIARALLRKPKILILDDSTSAVDTATEARIRKSFKEELNGSTKIIIAQRISSVQNADKIIVMDNGRITGIGTHDELLNSNNEYIEIYNSQIGKKEEA